MKVFAQFRPGGRLGKRADDARSRTAASTSRSSRCASRCATTWPRPGSAAPSTRSRWPPHVPATAVDVFPDFRSQALRLRRPLLGALVRPLGGWLSDRLGGGKVTFWNFAVMLVAAIAILVFLPSAQGSSSPSWFFASFVLLFVRPASATARYFHVVPNVFLKLHTRAAGKGKAAQGRAVVEGEIEASVALRFTAAIAALGLFFIPAMIGISMMRQEYRNG